MSYSYNNKQCYTLDGIPYLWNSGDTTTVPTNEVKLVPADGIATAYFGAAVAVGSGRIVVGAYYDDDKGTFSGSAYVYDLNGNLITKLVASDGASSDQYGTSVAVGCGRIVIGSPYDDSAVSDSGSVYIYDLTGTLVKKITPSDPAQIARFGRSVAVGCGKIVVGAYLDDDKGTFSGSVYIYDLNGNFLKKITAYDGASSDEYGTSVAVGCGKIVVGSPYDDDNGTDSGSAYIYDLSGNFIKKITAFDNDGSGYDRFGAAVAVGSGRIVVGAYQHYEPSGTGSVYIYDLSGNLIIKLKSSDGTLANSFGYSVAIGSGRIVVTSILYASLTGCVYIYDLDGKQLARLTASDGAAGDRFGQSVAVGCGKIVVGAYFDDDKGDSSGSAYIYTTPNVYNLYDALELQSY